MNEKQRIEQLEMVTSEMLQRQDRTNEELSKLKVDIQTIRTTQLKQLEIAIQQSDNIEYVLENQVTKKELEQFQEKVDTQFDVLLKAITDLGNQIEKKD